MGVTQRPEGHQFLWKYFLIMIRSIFLVVLFLLFYLCEVSVGQRYTKVTRTYYSNSRSNNNNQRSYNSNNRQRTYNNNSQSRFTNFQNFNGRKSNNRQNTYSSPNSNRRVLDNRNNQNRVSNGRNYQTRRLDTKARSYGDNNAVSRYDNNWPFFILSGGTFYWYRWCKITNWRILESHSLKVTCFIAFVFRSQILVLYSFVLIIVKVFTLRKK